MLRAGDFIGGRYRLIRLLGEGGMGVVWAAKNEAIDRDVAIKLMSPALAATEQGLQRFFTEARICGSIRHPGIVDVLDLGRADDGVPFLVMELLDGLALDRVIDTMGRLSIGMIVPIVRDVARTVALAHDKGVVHRDLKPANVFLHRSPLGPAVVKVLDFGISKVVVEGRASSTTTGMLLGTPAYMSPEQAGGRITVDHRTDVYALGVILFEALSGTMPFDAPSAQALLIDIATQDAPSFAGRMPTIPPELSGIVDACLKRDRERRIQTAREVAGRLEEALASLGAREELQDVLDLAIARGAAPRPASHRPPADVGPVAAAASVRGDPLAQTTPAPAPIPPTLASAGTPLAVAAGSAPGVRPPDTALTGSPVSSNKRAPTPAVPRSRVALVAGLGLLTVGLAVALGFAVRSRAAVGSDVVAAESSLASVTAAPAPRASQAAPVPEIYSAPTAVEPLAPAPSASTPVAATAPRPRGPAGPRGSARPKVGPAPSSSDGMWGYE